MIDGHIHFVKAMKNENLNQLISQKGLSGIALQCIPQSNCIPVEEDAFQFADQSTVPVYIFGGINRKVYIFPEEQMKNALVEEVKERMKQGCTGIKMLEGKPQIRKAYPIPDFDTPVWESFWAYLEEEKIPIYFHVNDPEEFWDVQKISRHALESGWLYDETFVNNEDQYRQIRNVLTRHPDLRILFPHFFFFSKQLERLSGILDRAPQMRIDITPGIELYYNLSSQPEEANAFFHKYQDRILYGTDIGAREAVREKGEPLSLAEAESRMSLICRFLETKGNYTLYPDGLYVQEGPTQMHGLGLDKTILEKIYETNFLTFIETSPNKNGRRKQHE